MRDLSHLIIDLNDVYGHTLPGAIVLLCAYFILQKTTVGPPLETGMLCFYGSSKVIFAISFLLVSFLLGHVTLFFGFLIFNNRIFRKSPNEILSSKNFSIDPTKRKVVINLFQKEFTDSALNNRNGLLTNFCTYFLLYKYPHLFTRLRGIEAHANLRGGILLPFLLMALTLGIYGQFALSILAIFFAAIFLWRFFRTIQSGDVTAIWLYYHAITGNGYPYEENNNAQALQEKTL